MHPTPTTGSSTPPSAQDLRGVVATREELVALARRRTRKRRERARRSDARLAGSRLSPFLGRGMEVTEVRGYQPGDDVRWIDWRSTARTGRVHTKLFAEERERPVWLVADLGPTMRFGTRGAFKSVVAARAAAQLAWDAHGTGASVGGIVGSPGVSVELPPGRTLRHVLRLLDVLAAATAVDGDPSPEFLTRELGWLRQRVRTGSRVAVIGDFYGLDDRLLAALRALAQRCELLLVWVVDALECEPPPTGRYRVSDGRETRSVESGRGSAWQRGFVKQFEERRRRLEELARRSRVGLVSLRTDEDPSAVTSSLDRAQPGRA
jgi:uncharacterized protein (DUF58 family)